jgi:hypothetical protein
MRTALVIWAVLLAIGVVVAAVMVKQMMVAP